MKYFIRRDRNSFLLLLFFIKIFSGTCCAEEIKNPNTYTNETLNPFESGLPVEIQEKNKYPYNFPTHTTSQLKELPSKNLKLDNLNKYENRTSNSPIPNIDSNEGKELTPQIPYEEISKFVQTVREKLCKINPHGSYEIWLSFGGTLGIFVSAKAETGMKAIIQCETSEHCAN